MRSPVLMDGRNIYDPAEMAALGFRYIAMGRAEPGAAYVPSANGHEPVST
jgi:hypothetical protein